MPVPDSRGRRLMEAAARLCLTVLNVGNVSTFRRVGCSGTIPDVTFASESLLPLTRNWKVMEDYTGSDHQYITVELTNAEPRIKVSRPPRWNVLRMDQRKLVASLEDRDAVLPEDHPSPRELAEAMAKGMVKCLQEACSKAMPRKKVSSNRRPAYWWNSEIAELRGTCHRLRRRAMRARNRPEAQARSVEYRQARRRLRFEIGRSKAAWWRNICEEINSDPWGQGYKIVRKKFGALSPAESTDHQTMMEIVDKLFPDHQERGEDAEREVGNIPPFTTAELKAAVRSLRRNRAPGPNGIPSEVLKVVVEECPTLLLDVYNACLRAGIFSSQWKTARLVLVDKGKGDGSLASSLRPLCMLDTDGKLFEKLLQPRLHQAINAAGGLSANQHGFRRGHSTINAIAEVVKALEVAESKNHHSWDIVLLVTLDVKNAFNSARWVDFIDALQNKFGVPEYLMRVMRDYLRGRTLSYTDKGGTHTKRLTAGAAQGSILGPDLWNCSYDRVLRAEMPEGAFLVGYADDVAAVISARSMELAQLKLNQVMRRIDREMEALGLTLATQKTEIVVLTRQRIQTLVPLKVNDVEILTKHAVRYLGVILDPKLTFWAHIERVADKGARMVADLSRLMANTRGPKSSKRRLLMSTVNSVLLYGAEIWADSLRYEKYRKRIAAVQRRGALRVACSYRTVSEPAVLLIAGVTPVHLMAAERRRVYLRLQEGEDRLEPSKRKSGNKQ
ncbi:Reverse transcriptase (RNA-dependent DNA polymerase) [Nesidiocoris tenuis]|uniref:Reverse transcriptase (RNA-dependent DNA polymerase) n=1 Tax=Nesidiocoris tenuis TaxID=355587 RepID=A0ABN7BFX6_9HEMI|nr:Reverse transcriptase (RNA-dependent DNA polymerase) [Nesidiocoris tenuis]